MAVAPEDLRRITLRVPSRLHQALADSASQRQVSLNRLAVEALQTYVVQEQQRFPLRELSEALASAAEARGLREDEVLRHVKEVRQGIWRDRYRDMVGESG